MSGPDGNNKWEMYTQGLPSSSLFNGANQPPLYEKEEE